MLRMIARHAQHEVRTKRIMCVEDPIFGQHFKWSGERGAMAAREFAENRRVDQDVLGELHGVWMTVRLLTDAMATIR